MNLTTSRYEYDMNAKKLTWTHRRHGLGIEWHAHTKLGTDEAKRVGRRLRWLAQRRHANGDGMFG